jgi:hypothetical protein
MISILFSRHFGIAKDGDDGDDHSDDFLHGFYSNEVSEVSRGHFALAIASLFWASVRLFQ